MENLAQTYKFFYHFLEMKISEQKKFLAELKESSPAIYSELLQMINIEKDATLFFDNLEQDLIASLFDRQHYKPGEIIGSYQLEDLVSHNGISYVFRTKHDTGTGPTAAIIKIIKRGLNNNGDVYNFRLSRSLRAGLTHKYLAQYYNGGITKDGLPYFVMEYVDGWEIKNFCRINTCTLKARLFLFLQICKAVAHAHRHEIIHRNIKPANVFIKSNGQPKLSGLGIAQLLDDNLKQGADRPDMQIFTREYASPEQIEGTEITTTSDIYQLGLLLYEIVTEKKAWSYETHQHHFLRKLLPAEVYHVVERATQPKPYQRYQSVDEMRTDVIKFLEKDLI